MLISRLATASRPYAATASRLLFRPLQTLLPIILPWIDRLTTATPPADTPITRPAAAIEPADTYGFLGPVWALIGGAWHPGLTLDASPGAAWTAYHIPGSYVSGVEQVPAAHLIRRTYQHHPAQQTKRQARATLRTHRPDPDGLCLGCTAQRRGTWFPCPDTKRAQATLAGQADPILQQMDQAKATLLIHRSEPDGLCTGCAESFHFRLFPCPEARNALTTLARIAHQLLGRQ